MKNAGLGPRKTWEDRMTECQDYYTLARQTGTCKECKATGVYLKSGRHPSGKGGRPVKRLGPDLEAVKKWIAEAGWVCQRCSLKVKVTTPAVEVKLKPWAPYPEEIRRVDEYVTKQLGVMRTGSDGMGVRDEEAVERFLAEQRRAGWIPEEEWFKGRQARAGGGVSLPGPEPKSIVL